MLVQFTLFKIIFPRHAKVTVMTATRHQVL